MPRPKRDYGQSIRADLERIDIKLRQLANERIKLQKMLEDYETNYDGDVEAVLKSIGHDDTAEAAAGRGRRRRRTRS